MRRPFALLAALLVLLPGSVAGASAQEASPAASPAAIALPPLLAEWAAAWTAHDPDRMLALYAPDGVYEEVPTNTVARGHDAIRAFLEFNFAVFSDVEVRPEAGFQGGGGAALQAVFAGRYTGQLPGLPAGTGQPFAVRFASVFELDGGLIRHNTDYFDNYDFLAQLGAAPAMTAPPRAAPTAEEDRRRARPGARTLIAREVERWRWQPRSRSAASRSSRTTRRTRRGPRPTG